MDVITTIYNPPLHKHHLSHTTRFLAGECTGCHVNENIYGGYICNELNCYNILFHKECAEAPLKINHFSHLHQHLLLTNDPGESLCDFCGQKILSPCYNCTTCEFKVDFICGMKPSPLAIEYPLCHNHPLVFLKKGNEKFSCEICKEYIDGPSYSCLQCNNLYFHIYCTHLSEEINHPCHSSHPLKLIATEALTDDAEKICLSCEVQPEKVLYHCSICNFSTCLICIRNPCPLIVENIKMHKHPLTRFSRRISYICDACGGKGNIGAYICLECDFIIHEYCIHLPHVININRHDHRISFTLHLGVGYSKCGVCRQRLSQYYGAFYCSVCPNYAVHSECVFKNNVWDGLELEGIQDNIEYNAPFKVVGEDMIDHFSHDKHHLKLYKNYILDTKWSQCEACHDPVGFGSIYSCEECDIVLHEKCANFSMKKRLIFHLVPYTLEVDTIFLDCHMCRTFSNGFQYKAQDKLPVDIHCGSLSEPFVHDGHLHPLYFDEKEGHYCNGCNEDVDSYVLHCDVCDFYLCFYCACLPEKLWYRNEEHPLILYCGEIVSYNNSCDSCEQEISSCRWFYTCFDCEVTLHARCLLGDFSRLKLESEIFYKEKSFKVVANNHNTRPVCIRCHSRCKACIILKDLNAENGYICSRSCLLSYLG